MDMIREICEMKETIAHEIAEANKRIRNAGGQINTEDLDIIDKLAHSMKSLATTAAMMEAEEEGGYSGAHMPPWPQYRDGGGYARENRGGYGYSRENRNGYSGNGGGYSRNNYSRENRIGYGYSRTGDMTEQLRQMMEEAPDEMTRMEIKKLMDRMENQR